MKSWHFFLIPVLFIAACKQIRPLLQNTVRGKYESSFGKKDSLFTVWKAAHERAMANPLQVSLPYTASLQIKHATASALVYSIPLRKGEMLVAEVRKPADSSRILLEFFNGQPANTGSLLAELQETRDRIDWAAREDDSIRVSVQPFLNDSGAFHIKLYKQPAYRFPVAGKDNRAMQSFWGAGRDGGARSHEGIDIFAARGTPVVAVADGRIGFSGERGIGGKQVWLREELTGFNVYYAHLDSFVVTGGEAVKRGDTLGFVGNTGNAAGGSPHLHFGVYGNSGAVDPLAFIKQLPIPDNQTYTLDATSLPSSSTMLRKGPGTRYPTLLQLSKNEPMKIQARSGNWLQVVVRDSVAGFVPK